MLEKLITIENFYFRAFKQEDLDILCDIYADPDVTEFSVKLNRQQVAKILERYLSRYRDLGIAKFGAFTENGDKFVGGCGFDILHDPDSDRNPLPEKGSMNHLFQGDLELGYWFYKEYWGKGIANLLARTIVEYAFTKFPNLNRIVAVTDPDNIASQKVLKKIGFEFVTTVESLEYGKEEFFVLYRYS